MTMQCTQCGHRITAPTLEPFRGRMYVTDDPRERVWCRACLKSLLIVQYGMKPVPEYFGRSQAAIELSEAMGAAHHDSERWRMMAEHSQRHLPEHPVPDCEDCIEQRWTAA